MVHASNASDDRRQRQRARRARHFLDAAQAVLERDGVDGLTIAAVAARADAAIGTIYRYFDGKDALFAALQVRAIQAFDDHLETAMASAADPVDALRRSARAWRSFARADPRLFALLDASLSDPAPNLSDEAARQVEAALRPVLDRIGGAFAQAAAIGSLVPGDPELRTYALWATAHGAAHFRKRDRLGGPTAAAVADQAVEALLRGWAAPTS